jgi:hypothetical protein
MLGGIVKRNPPIKMRLRFRDRTRAQQRNTCDQEWTRRSLFLGERQDGYRDAAIGSLSEQ